MRYVSGTIKTGATSWAERGLIASGWYPEEARSAEERLRYYASQFPLVENDSPYWVLPDKQRVSLWVRRTPPGFTMNMKAHALMTGHYTDPRRLPKDLREALPRAVKRKTRVYPRDVGAEVMTEVRRRFHEALKPLHRSGKLGVVLLQFPVWFPGSRENQEELPRIREELRPYRVAVEFRNATWMADRNLLRTLELLAASGIAYTCVDEPQGFVSSVPPVIAATTRLAVVRLHGQNAAVWSRGARSASERFRYRYSSAELQEWVPRIRALATRAREVHVLFNNCHADDAVVNARQMAELLAGKRARRERREQEPVHAP